MPGSIRSALEEAIFEGPDDVAAFSAYADLLMESGDLRGELISVQLALESPSCAGAERRRLQAREKALLKKHEHNWLGNLATLLLDSRDEEWWRHCEYRWERGRVAVLNVRGRLGVEFARRLVNCSAELRLLRELHLNGVEYAANDTFEPGPDVPPEVADRDHAAALYVLSKADWLAGLRVLRIGSWIDESYSKWYPGDHHCPGHLAHLLVEKTTRLEELYLMAYDVVTKDIFSRSLPSLRILQVYDANEYPLHLLAENPSLTNLTHLLCHPKALMHYHKEPLIRLPGASAILRSKYLQRLAHLRLRLSDMGDSGCYEIVDSGALKRLKTLDLRHGCITDEGARVLAACPDLTNLELLDVSWNRLTPADIALLAEKVKVEARSQYDPHDEDEDDLYLSMGDIE
jgi:uncharacterized protein (TIGR02996 family)